MGSPVTRILKSRQVAALRGHKLSNIALFFRGCAERGFVAFDLANPPGIAFALHVQNLIPAIETASRFLETDYAAETEWILTGEDGRSIMMMVQNFHPNFVEGRYAYDQEMQAIRLGDLFHRPVYFNRQMPKTDMLVFNSNQRVCRFLFHNVP